MTVDPPSQTETARDPSSGEEESTEGVEEVEPDLQVLQSGRSALDNDWRRTWLESENSSAAVVAAAAVVAVAAEPESPVVETAASR